MKRRTGLGVSIGAGPGIGLALARALAAEGVDLALVVREGDPMEPFDRALRAFPVDSRCFACDAGNPAELEMLLKEIQGLNQPTELLVYNASRSIHALPSSLPPEALRADLEVHLGGALRSVQAVLPGMRARGRGTILFTGGGSALHPRVAETSLGLGKGALRTLALLLAEELEPEGIHVATVTIDGYVNPGTALDPDLIAKHYLALHAEARGNWRREVVVAG